MKILLVHNSYQQPGGEDVVFDLERDLLVRGGHEIVTYCRSNKEADELSGIGRLGLVKRIVWADDSRSAVLKLLHQEKPKLAHIHNTFFMTSPSVYSACQEAGVPVVQTLHNYRLLCPGATLYRSGGVCEDCLDHSLWHSVRHGCHRDSHLGTAAIALMLDFHRRCGTWTNQVQCYIALTEFARQKFIQGGLPADRIQVKPNFVADPGPRSKTGDYALFVGRLSEEKGILSLLEAWSRLRSSIPLRIVGDGPLRSPIQARLSRNGLGAVSMVGRVPRDKTLEAMKQACFLVFPSEWYEGFPMTIAEAFACGLPVICSALGSMAEIVDDGKNGLHFKAGDPDDLAKKVEWAGSHPAEMEEMGRQARVKYEAHYTPPRNYSTLMGIYQSTINATSLQTSPVAG